MKKALAFIAGFGIAFLGMAFIFSQLGVMIQGPIAVSLCVAGGLLASWLVESPKKHIAGGLDAMKPVTRPWWELDKRLRLAIVAGCIWIGGSYMIQDSYDRNLGIVFIPPIAVLLLHFGVSTMVEKKEPNHHAGLSLNEAHRTDTPSTFKQRNSPLTPPPESAGTLSPTNGSADAGQYPYGITLVNGQYQFDQFRYDRLKDAVAYAEITTKNVKTEPATNQEAETRDVYKLIAMEFETGTIDKGLWVRLFAECDGDEIRTKVRYIRDRATRLNGEGEAALSN